MPAFGAASTSQAASCGLVPNAGSRLPLGSSRDAGVEGTTWTGQETRSSAHRLVTATMGVVGLA
jgi:hypothetical protein